MCKMHTLAVYVFNEVGSTLLGSVCTNCTHYLAGRYHEHTTCMSSCSWNCLPHGSNVYMCMCICMCTCMCIWMCICVHKFHVYMYMYVYVYACVLV